MVSLYWISLFNRGFFMYQLRPIRKEDNVQVAEVIRVVMTEFDCVGEGFSIMDKEVDAMSDHYKPEDRALYYVLEHHGKIVGGGGIAHLEGAEGTLCELKKMYFLPSARGKGQGWRMLEMCLESARRFAYKACYLETVQQMGKARILYEKAGFKALDAPLGNTGHNSCDRYYLLKF